MEVKSFETLHANFTGKHHLPLSFRAITKLERAGLKCLITAIHDCFRFQINSDAIGTVAI